MQAFISTLWLYKWYFVLAIVGILVSLGFFSKLPSWIGQQPAQDVEKAVDEVVQIETGVNPNVEGKS